MAKPSPATQARHQTPLAMLRLTGRGVLDALGSPLHRPPRLIPLAGEPGVVAALTTPDAIDGGRALNPENQYPDWRQESPPVRRYGAASTGLVDTHAMFRSRY